MRRALMGVLAAVALGGCVSILQDMYDDQARSDCDQISRPSERSSCYDRVEQNSRDRQ